jgi:hypothetical protein
MGKEPKLLVEKQQFNQLPIGTWYLVLGFTARYFYL